MNKKWDYTIPTIEHFQEMLRVAKPGATLLCFGGTRTWHRIAINIEDAGWEIKNTLMWIYGVGFPKSLDISKALDKKIGAERTVIGITKGSGGENLNKISRINGNDSKDAKGCGAYGQGAKQINIDISITAPATESAKRWNGWGTGLKPAWEPIIMAMKPNDGTYAENALKWGVAGLNINEGRIPIDPIMDKSQLRTMNRSKKILKDGWGMNDKSSDIPQVIDKQGRFPSNFLMSCSCENNEHEEDCPVRILDEQSGTIKCSRIEKPSMCDEAANTWGGTFQRNRGARGYDDIGGASRFFYCGKVSRKERGEDNKHPTIKPLALMEYLCLLTRTPTRGIVLDPYCGSGTTCMAAKKMGRNFIGIEIEEEYCEIARKRIGAVN